MRARGLSFTYATRLKPALVDLGFEVAPGEAVLVLGPSGSGKSTLTLCLDGLIPHLVQGEYQGEVWVAGLPVRETPVPVLARQVGLVFQDPDSQFCTLTVEDEIAFGLENLGVEPARIEEAIDQALQAVRLPGYRRRRLSELSGGEKQRVALASVLAMGPSLLVLDEPSANLDPRATSDLFGLLRTLREERRHTLIIIEHKLDEVIEWIDSVLILDEKGRLLFRGDPAEAFYDRGGLLEQSGIWRPQTAELVRGLRRAGWRVPGRPLAVSETARALAMTPGLLERLGERLHPGADTDDFPGKPGTREAVPEEPLLEVRDLSYRYPGGQLVLERVSFTVTGGHFVALAGANGAGKTTLACLVSGVLSPEPGQVFLRGRDVRGLSAREIGALVGHVFQNPEHQFVTDTVRGELAYSLLPRARRRPEAHLDEEQRWLVDSWLERLGLLGLAEANPFSLSHGQKRRLSVAAMLIRGQELLLLDEPTLGQDERQVTRLMALMQDFQAGGGTVLMITHDMRLVAEYADWLLVLRGGSLVYEGEPEGFLARPAAVEKAGLRTPALGGVCAALLERLEPGRPVSTGLPWLTVSSFLGGLGLAEPALVPPGPRGSETRGG